MKTTIISIIIFLITLLGGSYFLKDKNIPVLSILGQDISKLVLNEFDTYPEFENTQLVHTEDLIKTETANNDIYNDGDRKLADGFNKTETINIKAEDSFNESNSNEISVEQVDVDLKSDILLCSDDPFKTGQDFINNLNSCSNYECQYTHPFFADETMTRKIQNQGTNCIYTEEMPNNGLMTCTFLEQKRLAAANYYQKISDGAEVSTKVNITFNNEGSETKVSEEIDGEASELTLNDFLADGTCVVTGYDN